MATNPDGPLTLLGGLTAREFLRDHWQQKPLLVRQAIPGFESPLSPEELAGLACEAEVISRLVRERPEGGGWEVCHGPFDDEDFTALPDSHWTLLVSDLEKHLPDLRACLDPFRFLPDWRMDDLMVSYAAPHGSVGPHVDQYDVFLLQASGRRRWQISTVPVDAGNFIPDLALRIIRDFAPEQDWLLEPGDMLYLPPGVAHHGVAHADASLGPCMTWSVGFRAPAWRDLLAAWVDSRYERLDPDARYADPGLNPRNSPGEIDASALDRLLQGLREAFGDNAGDLKRWLGCYLTEPKQELLELTSLPAPLDEAAVQALLHGTCKLERHGGARLAWMRVDTGVSLFVNAQEHCFGPEAEPLALCLCDQWILEPGHLLALARDIPGGVQLLEDLCRNSVLVPVLESGEE